MIDKAAWRSIRAAGKGIVAKDLDLTVTGLDHLPAEGPVLLVARHYHHLYDGCAVMATIPRQVQVLVGLDWIEQPMLMRAMQQACRSAGWPVVYRNTNEVSRALWLPALRVALQQSREILRAGKILLVFPEAYPTIDPHFTPKTGSDEILPFHAGFAQIARNACLAGIPVRIVPLGFHYQQHDDKWQVAMRFGEPIPFDASMSAGALAAATECRVRELSRP